MGTLHSQHRPAWESGELTVPLLGVGQGGAADVPVACSAFEHLRVQKLSARDIFPGVCWVTRVMVTHSVQLTSDKVHKASVTYSCHPS